MLYNTYDQFKKATKSTFEKIKSNPHLKLSQFRDQLVKDSGFENQQSIKKLYEVQTENINEYEYYSIFEMFKNCACLVKNEDWIKAKYVDGDFFTIIYDGNINKNGIFMEEYSIELEIKSLTIKEKSENGYYFIVDGNFNETEEGVWVKFFIPMEDSGEKIKIHEESESGINVIKINNDEVEKFYFEDTLDGIERAKECFCEILEDTISNFEEYTSEDLESCIEQGYENFGNGCVFINIE